MSLHRRRRLPHEVPLWVNPAEEIYFITICCQPQHHNQLAITDTAAAIFETVRFRNAQRMWFAYLFLLMPDHVHALISFPPTRRPLKAVISGWKEWTAKRIGIHWQRDFFEHRLRREESRRQKADYILNNPIRAGLVARAEDWPYVWFPEGTRPDFES
jgi:REP element-mobilizing transposase RayT